MMNSITKKLVSCALCIALGVLLPMAFHVIPNAGSIFLPMHIPVLICGLFCGWPYGLACGILTPFIEYIKLDRDKSTFKSHRDFSSEKEITFKHL